MLILSRALQTIDDIFSHVYTCVRVCMRVLPSEGNIQSYLAFFEGVCIYYTEQAKLPQRLRHPQGQANARCMYMYTLRLIASNTNAKTFIITVQYMSLPMDHYGCVCRLKVGPKVVEHAFATTCHSWVWLHS